MYQTFSQTRIVLENGDKSSTEYIHLLELTVLKI